jgi:hypothetical protein
MFQQNHQKKMEMAGLESIFMEGSTRIDEASTLFALPIRNGWILWTAHVIGACSHLNCWMK